MKLIPILSILIILMLSATNYAQRSLPYPIVDTGQTKCYDNTQTINPPQPGQAFYGQDAQHHGYQPQYQDHGDGTVTDRVTGLMWQKSLPNAKYSYQKCVEYADTCTLAGYTDWRLPRSRSFIH